MGRITSFIKSKYPKFLVILVFTELWERFSYYSMRGILTLYMVTQMGLDETYAMEIYSLTTSIGYILPIIAGTLADKIYGFRAMIFVGGLTVTLGHIILSFSVFTDIFFFWGIALVSVGTGLFKGNITNLLGSSYDTLPHLDRLSGFTLFYSGINLGAFVSSFTTGYSSEYVSYHFAFFLAAIGMVVGLILFSWNRYLYVDKDFIRNPDKLNKKYLGFLDLRYFLGFAAFIFSVPVALLFYYADVLADINIVLYIAIIAAIVLIAFIFFLKDTREKKNYLILLIYFLVIMVFFSFELQLGSLFVLFIQRNVYRYVGSLYIPTAVSSSFNPALIMIVGFVMSNLKNTNDKFDSLRMFLGLLSNTACFLILWWGTLSAHPENALTSLAFPFFGIVTMASGEVLMAPLVQASTTKFAPKGYKGLMMGMYMGMLGFAGLTGFIFADIFDIPESEVPDDPFVSLPVFKEGFLKVALYNLIFVALFIICIPLIWWLKKPSESEKKQALELTTKVQV